jgi:amidase
MDQKAATDGVEAIAPLYGLPVPMKGTAAVVQYPSGAGCGVLSGYAPVKDSAFTVLIKERNGIIFGTTNVPEFAFSYRTANPASGHTRNPYGSRLTVGGSSGGAASAVAAYMCPVAVTEDTGGSTRVPATCNQNFGFDPSRNHFPNAGNPGLTYFCDQLGLNARSIEDIMLLDAALGNSGRPALHDGARRAVAERPAASIRVGAPARPFAVGERLSSTPT